MVCVYELLHRNPLNGFYERCINVLCCGAGPGLRGFFYKCLHVTSSTINQLPVIRNFINFFILIYYLKKILLLLEIAEYLRHYLLDVSWNPILSRETLPSMTILVGFPTRQTYLPKTFRTAVPALRDRPG